MPFRVRSYGKSQLWIKFCVCKITNLIIMDDSAHLIFLIMYVCIQMSCVDLHFILHSWMLIYANFEVICFSVIIMYVRWQRICCFSCMIKILVYEFLIFFFISEKVHLKRYIIENFRAIFITHKIVWSDILSWHLLKVLINQYF